MSHIFRDQLIWLKKNNKRRKEVAEFICHTNEGVREKTTQRAKGSMIEFISYWQLIEGNVELKREEGNRAEGARKNRISLSQQKIWARKRNEEFLSRSQWNMSLREFKVDSLRNGGESHLGEEFLSGLFLPLWDRREKAKSLWVVDSSAR